MYEVHSWEHSPVPHLPEANAAAELNLEEFQVVRREFFSHTQEPAVTFNRCKFYVNAACLASFPDTNHIQILIHQTSCVLALRPCREPARDALAWCVLTEGRRRPRKVSCTLFVAKIAALMNWSTDCRYRILGRLVRAEGDVLLVFDLSAAEVYQNRLGESARANRTPVFPTEWRDRFGLPVAEHARAVEIPVLDGYTVYAVQDSATSSAREEESATS